MKKILTLIFILTAFSSFAQNMHVSNGSSSMQSTIRSNNTQGRIIEGNSPYADRRSASRYTYDGTGMEGSYNSDYEYLSNGVKQTIRSYGSSTPNGTVVEEVIIYKSSN